VCHEGGGKCARAAREKPGEVVQKGASAKMPRRLHGAEAAQQCCIVRGLRQDGRRARCCNALQEQSRRV